MILFHDFDGFLREGDQVSATCVCGYQSDLVSSELEARHRHDAHAWVKEPYAVA